MTLGNLLAAWPTALVIISAVLRIVAADIARDRSRSAQRWAILLDSVGWMGLIAAGVAFALLFGSRVML